MKDQNSEGKASIPDLEAVGMRFATVFQGQVTSVNFAIEQTGSRSEMSVLFASDDDDDGSDLDGDDLDQLLEERADT